MSTHEIDKETQKKILASLGNMNEEWLIKARRDQSRKGEMAIRTNMLVESWKLVEPDESEPDS